jgi:hypothetical protein
MPDIDRKDTMLNWVSENDLDIDHLPLTYLNRLSFVLRGIFGNWPDFAEVEPVTHIRFVAYGLSAVSCVTKSARRDVEATEPRVPNGGSGKRWKEKRPTRQGLGAAGPILDAVRMHECIATTGR